MPATSGYPAAEFYFDGATWTDSTAMGFGFYDILFNGADEKWATDGTQIFRRVGSDWDEVGWGDTIRELWSPGPGTVFGVGDSNYHVGFAWVNGEQYGDIQTEWPDGAMCATGADGHMYMAGSGGLILHSNCL